MSKKSLLLFGSEGSLGQEIIKQFKDQYEIVRCARGGEHSDYTGDLSDQKFLEKINNEIPNPDVLINCCAAYTSDFLKNFKTNIFSPMYTTYLFYQSMRDGRIINIGSQARYAGGQIYSFMSDADIYYSFSKKVLGEFSEVIAQSSKNKKVKVTVIEPEYLEKGLHGQAQDTYPSEVDLISYASVVNAISFCLSDQTNGEITQLRIRNMRL